MANINSDAYTRLMIDYQSLSGELRRALKVVKAAKDYIEFVKGLSDYHFLGLTPDQKTLDRVIQEYDQYVQE